MTIRTVRATRYVTPLREGGSLPAIVEADDDGMYVLKFRGAGQGPRALIAELIGGEIGRALGLPVPEIVFVDLDPELASGEPDPEIQALVQASGGTNLALDYLPAAAAYDPLTPLQPDAGLASEIVWFDAYITNVDRTPRNPNMLFWHERLYLIDHGAALYFHHAWGDYRAQSRSPFARIADHVLLPLASDLVGADLRLRSTLTPEIIWNIVAQIPDGWLDEPSFPDPDAHRAAYATYLEGRVDAGQVFLAAAVEARAARGGGR
jgi:hypothetical protein